MRAGVWCGAAALALITLASALRTSQVEGAIRASRRLPAPSAPEDRIETDTNDVPTFRPRTSRRREELPRGEERLRGRSRLTEAEEETSDLSPQTPRNERFDSRRTYSRTRNRPVESEPISNPTGREYLPRSKTRNFNRENQRPQQTEAPVAISSPKFGSNRPKTYNPSTYKPKLTFTVTTPRTDDTTTQFKQNGSTTPATESLTTRRRGRFNTRVDTRALDLAVSGTTNTITLDSKEPTTARTADDIRNARKFRYRTRLSETDTNLTGEGITSNNKVSKSSQNKENITSQPEIQTLTPDIVITVQSSTEISSTQSSSTKAVKIERRPLIRSKGNFRPPVPLKKKQSDEISEDDNYPESFKALLQAKNASTQSSSPRSESLSVKASQKVLETNTSSPQSTHNGLPKNKYYSRFRSKISAIDEPKMEESKTETHEDEIPKQSTKFPEQKNSRAPEFRLRSTYNPRNRKISNFSTVAPSAAPSISSEQSNESPRNKYNRKFKPRTTDVPSIESTSKFKRLDTATLLKKSLARPAYNSRRNSSKSNNVSSEGLVSTENDSTKKDSTVTYIKTLPRTSYYSRLRSKNNDSVSTSSSTEANIEPSTESPAEKKIENSADMPLIFSLMKNHDESDTHNTTDKEKSLVSTNEPERERKMFIIAVTSKESSENSTENEVPNKTEEIEDKMFVDHLSAAQKFHANYKNKNSDTSEKKDQEIIQSTPRSKSYLPTRRNGRKRMNPEYNEEISEVSPKTRERNHQRKYSESLPKTTEPSTNGIPPEPEKLRSRYSSKYRSSYIDKPYYKPTIPTVTPSTAWLKFFVTDPQLAKSVEEPYWFEGDDIFVTTEMSRHTNTTTSPSSHESSLELVEGEEMQLGPDMNAISFTKTRSTLSSADLRLSESLDKPLHIMNVEASQHSPSVTVSIFDALAEILTSTPRTPRLSSTTDVTQKQNINDITLNGVSNSITVNTIRGLATQDTFTTIADVNLNTKFVQTTAQTPTVINSQLVTEVVTPSLNTQDGNDNPVNTPIPPTPPPTTPVSVRKPFAIKLLYTDTESPIDKTTTTESIRTSTQPPTDIPETVLNTVSDFLLTNNHLVSSELTSMLSKNIKNIMQNMDEATRSKISVDMAKLLKTLIPRALDGLSTGNNDVEKIQETTPYSLEEIRDTANISIDNKTDIDILEKNDISISESLQSVVTDNSVNSKSTSISTTLGDTKTPTLAVNSDELLSGSKFSVSNSQMTLADKASSTESVMVLKSGTTSIITSTSTPTPSMASSSDSSDTESVSTVGDGNRIGTDNTNTNVPFPFLTNFKVRDFSPSDTVDMDSSSPTTLFNTISSTQSIPLTKSGMSAKITNNNLSVQEQDLNRMGPLQLWVLNKKARVLQMIEDLLRKHNSEIQTVPPMTELLDQPNNIPLSNRLTEILNTMSSTTEATDIITENITPPMITQSINSFPLISTQPTTVDSGDNLENGPTTSIFTSIFGNGMMSTTTQAASDIFSQLAFTGLDTSKTQVSTVEVNTATSTSSFEEIESSTAQASTETTTEVTNTDTVQTNTELMSTTKLNTTPEAIIADTTNKPAGETKQNLISVVSNKVNIPKEPPKKDYVIFGILPNNTVVRKDPNDDILETLTEASPYIVYSLLPNNTVIRRFPNGTRVPRVMQKIDVLPISPWTLRNPYSPIHNNPAIVRPRNPIRVSTNIETSSDTSNNGTENRLTIDTVNNQQMMIPTILNINDSLGVTTVTNRPPAEKSTASHVLSLRTSTMLPSIDEILLNSISSAVKEEMVISSMMSSTREPTILTLDIDPETGQIRTEKPGDGTERTVFKFIPIDEVTVAPQGTNVLKLASTKAPSTHTMSSTETFATFTEINTQTPQIQTRQETHDPTTTEKMAAATRTPIEVTTVFTNPPATTESSISPHTTVATVTQEKSTSTEAVITTLAPKTTSTEATTTAAASTYYLPTVSPPLTTAQDITFSTLNIPATISLEEKLKPQEGLQLSSTERNPKSLDVFSSNNQLVSTDSRSTVPFTGTPARTTQTDEETKLLQALLSINSQNPSTVSISNLGGNIKVNTGAQTSTSRSIEDDIRQFEEDTKLLKALLAATGRDPASLNIPSLESLNIPTRATTPLTPATQRTTTTTMRTTTTPRTTTMTTTPQVTTTFRAITTTQSVSEDLRKLTEDAKLLQALIQAAGQNINSAKPVISGVTSNVRIASNPKTTTVGSNPTTFVNVRPTFTSRTTTRPEPVFLSPVLTTLQPSTTTETSSESTTLRPNSRRRVPITTTVATARRAPSPRFTVTTEIPSTSTFSDEEDFQFLQNLKSVLNNNPNQEDPEAGLANRIIALAVERSLNEIESGKQANDGRTGKTVVTTPFTNPVTTTTTTTTTTTSTTARTTTSKDNTPSLEDDIKQFQEDTKLLQALLKATGQDPSKFNIPTLPPIVNSDTKVSSQLPTRASDDLNLLSNLLASPSPLNEPFDSLSEKPKSTTLTTARTFGAKIAVKDNLKTENDDAKLLQTLVKLQGVTETTTQRSKLAITGQSPEEALKKLVQQTKSPGMMSDATKAPVSLSTEYGKSNDALLAALLKEQGFGPTTASSLDEQLRLAALLNQVVVTPKARRTTTTLPPPPPPPPRRPILDGLAWLWQQWRDTDPGRPVARPNRRPVPSIAPASSAASSNRVPWFGSGPFVGNADDQPSSNRVPLEPPRAVTSEQAPGRGQLVSAAINVTRAFSQFLGAAIAGAAQTVQSVIRAGQRATADAYSTGSG